MKSLKITTYCTWTSVGSVLQALGLKKALRELDCNSSIWLNKRDNRFTTTRIRSPKTLLTGGYERLIHKKRYAAYKKRMLFINRNIDIEYFTDYKDLSDKASTDCYEGVLAGSDQIWHPDKCDPVFFLDFVKDKKRLSYGASMGKTDVNEDKKERFGQLINNFDSISVREQECADVISEYTDKEIAVHIDPTFLVSADEWRKYEVEYKIKKPYILLYMLYWNDECKTKIKELKKKTGLPVYAISSGLSKVYADKHLFDVGPGEFLWLIDHAEYVVTSSFHGVAFSTVFNKKYAAVNNPKLPSRIDNLLRTVSLPKVDVSSLTEQSFDYDTVNQRITEEKHKSMEYLRRIIN